MAVRQDLHRLSSMGWPDGYKEEYIRKEHAPSLKVMQLSMLADEYIDDITKKRAKQDRGQG